MKAHSYADRTMSNDQSDMASTILGEAIRQLIREAFVEGGSEGMEIMVGEAEKG